MEAKGAEALERLLDVAVRLHENGTLDLLENLSEVSSEALSYLTDPKVLRIWANIAYFLHFLELELGEQLHKGYGRNYDTRNLQKPSKGWDLGHNKGTWGSRCSEGARLHFPYVKSFGKKYRYLR